MGSHSSLLGPAFLLERNGTCPILDHRGVVLSQERMEQWYTLHMGEPREQARERKLDTEGPEL